jgi:very-short-patch-repair endonuclease
MTPAAATLKRESAAVRRGALEERMALQLRAVGLVFEREFKFHPVRRWRFDFADPAKRLALEVDGGTHSNGRHNRAAGYTEDCLKMAEATLLGWRVFRATGEQVKSGEALRWIEQAVKQ